MKYFLGFTLDIIDDEASPIFFGCDENSKPEIISLNKVDFETKELIVFNAPLLINYFKKNKIPLPQAIEDIFQIYKLSNGKPIKYHKYPQTRVLWMIFSKFVENHDELKSVINTLNDLELNILGPEREGLLLLYLSYMIRVYSHLLTELKEKGEYERYVNIEKPFNIILANRQYEGLCVNSTKLNEKINSVSTELDLLNKRLRYEYSVFNSQNISEIQSVLQHNNFTYLFKVVKSNNRKSFWNFVKTASDQNIFLKLIYDSYRLSFDKSNLIKIVVEDDGRIHPFFDCCGTITSRTQVRMPHIQQLKKTSRDIFSAKNGYTLLYADYSQFEPGILASMSEDTSLINCYNQEDLYASLSTELFGDNSLRALCKIIFLSFMYGMSSNGLENLIKDIFHETRPSKKIELKNFFAKFTKLIPYKILLQDIAMKEKKVGSAFGNYRYFENESVHHLPSKVKRWVLSQRIQGTASLILKMAIINSCVDKKIEFLIPMHDAALFQVPTELLEEKKKIIKSEFENAMLQYCPKLKPKVIFKNFTE